MTTHHTRHRSHRRHVEVFSRAHAALAIVLLALLLSFAMLSLSAPGAFTSSEISFTDPSPSGLHIIAASGESPPPANCDFNGITIAHGGYADAYLSPSVPYGYPCYYEARVCTDGSLSGSYAYSSCYAQPRPAPTCSLSVTPAAVNRGSSSTLSWSSANADSFYITSISYVTPNVAGSTSVAPTVTTTYTGTAAGNGSVQCQTTLTVYQPCTFAGGSIAHGVTVTGYQAETVPYGSSCVSELRTCTNGTLSGTYGHASCSVTAAANCSLDSVTVTHGDSRTFYSTQVTTGGALCADSSLSRSCSNGTLSGSGSYQYANCSCAAAYTCSGSDIRYTNTSCNTSTVATCSAPSSCFAGQSTCQWPAISPSPFTNNNATAMSGHLTAQPSLIRAGDTTSLYWAVDNAASCTVSGGGQTWNLTSSGVNGRATNPITQRTRYTLHCDGYEGQADLDEFIDVLVQPTFNET